MCLTSFHVFCEQVDFNPNSARYLMISNAPNIPCQPRGTPWRPSIYFIQFAAYKSPAIVESGLDQATNTACACPNRRVASYQFIFLQGRQIRKHGEDIRESSYRYKVWCSIVQLILWSAEYPLLVCIMLWEAIIKYSCKNQFRLDYNHLIYCLVHEMENVCSFDVRAAD